MKFVFRADATETLGSGHIMRCMSLAHVLRQRGAEIVFVALDIPEHLAALLSSAGHEVERLPADVRGDEDSDAQATLACTRGAMAYVLDHYALGPQWERQVKAHAPVLALDDLGRPHESNWVLDQNFYAQPQARYAGQLTPETSPLLGPAYALLRPEFEAGQRRAAVRDQGIRNILVSLGGMDADQITGKALRAIELSLPLDVQVAVIVGASYPALDWIQNWCSHRGNASVHVQVHDMDKYLLAADLAIGAGGSSTWERCACGLPTVTLCLADNQREVIREGIAAGFLWGFDSVPAVEELADVLRVLYRAPGQLAHMSRHALSITDARGAKRVADVLMLRSVQVRTATLDDARKIYDWRSDPGVQGVSRTSAAFSFEDHCDWLKRTLANPNRILLIGQHEQADIGVVRFDVESDRAEVSIFLAPHLAGAGLGGAMLQAAEAHLRTVRPDVQRLDAWVNEGNQSSLNMFNRLGYSTRISRLEKEIA